MQRSASRKQRLSDDFLFSAPPDPKLDRGGYFERCSPRGRAWPGIRFRPADRVGRRGGRHLRSNASGGGRGRNTEVFTFDDEDKIIRTEVYFGWALE